MWHVHNVDFPLLWNALERFERAASRGDSQAGQHTVLKLLLLAEKRGGHGNILVILGILSVLRTLSILTVLCVFCVEDILCVEDVLFVETIEA